MQVGGGAAIYLQVLFIGNLPPNSKDEMGEMAEDGLIYNSSQKADRRGAGGWAQTGCRSDGAENTG